MNYKTKKWNLVFCLFLSVLLTGQLLASSARAKIKSNKAKTKTSSTKSNPVKDPANEAVARLEKTYFEAKSLEADLLQEVYQATLERTKTSKGSIKLAKPGFVRWDTQEPEASVLVSNGRNLWYYTPNAGAKGKGQALSQNPRELQKQPLFRILAGTRPLEPDFKRESYKTMENGGFEFKLVPVTPMADLKEVTLTISSTHLIEAVNLEYKTGNKTKIMLQNQKLNGKFPAEIFHFKPPEGTEILRN